MIWKESVSGRHQASEDPDSTQADRDILIFLSTNLMGSIDIIKPLSTSLEPALSMNPGNIEINFKECRESNQGALGEECKCCHCAMQLP